MAEDFYQGLSEEFCQGDIFDTLPHALVAESIDEIEDKPGFVAAKCKRDRAILLTHDCQIDKPELRSWLVCPIRRLDAMSRSIQGDIKKNRVYPFLHLPEYRDVLPASFVDFNHVTALEPALVKSADRIVSLSNLGRRALYSQFIRWLTRWELRKLKCPACTVEFDPADFLPVRPG